MLLCKPLFMRLPEGGVERNYEKAERNYEKAERNYEKDGTQLRCWNPERKLKLSFRALLNFPFTYDF